MSAWRSWPQTLLLTCVAVLILPLLAPPPSSALQAGRGSGGELRLYYWQAPTTTNPHLSAGSKDLAAARLTYEPLASFDAEGILIPFLAAEIPSLENGGVATDGKSVTWNLKPGILWSDGEPFTADDVLFTYEYVMNATVGSTSAGSYQGIDRIEVVDDTTLTIRFKDVTPGWFVPFTGLFGMILPRHVFAPFANAGAADAPANLAPVGTGPFRVTSFTEASVLVIGEDVVSTIEIRYEANPNYRDPEKPFFASVLLTGGGGDAETAAQVLVDNQTDYSWNVQLNQEGFDAFSANPDIATYVSLDAFTERIMINFTDPNQETATGERSSVEFPHPFFQDLTVRKAFAHAVNRDAVAELYGPGGDATTNLLVSPPSLRSPNTAELYPFDLSRAAALLDEAGWVDTNGDGVRDKDGVQMRVTFLTSITPARQGAQEIVKADLESIGVSVELKSVDSSIFLGPPEESTNTRRQFYADLEEFAFSNKSPDPTAYLAGWTCDQIAQQENNWAKPNWARYCNEDFDALFQAAASEPDPDKRTQLYIAMNDLLINDVAVIPLVHLSLVPAVRSNITGLDPTPWEADVWNIADWRAR